MKNYNYDLAIKIVNTFNELDLLDEASMGMHEDWFWTAQAVWKDGEWQVNLLSNEDADKMYEEFIEKRKNGLRIFLDKCNPEYEKYSSCQLGGLRGSDWATPVIQVNLKDGTEKTFNCFIGENEVAITHGINCEYPIINKDDEFWQWIGEVKDNPNLEDN